MTCSRLRNNIVNHDFYRWLREREQPQEAPAVRVHLELPLPEPRRHDVPEACPRGVAIIELEMVN